MERKQRPYSAVRSLHLTARPVGYEDPMPQPKAVGSGDPTAEHFLRYHNNLPVSGGDSAMKIYLGEGGINGFRRFM